MNLHVNLNHYPYSESFEKKFADILGVLDFAGDAEGSRQHINHFVEEVTKNHIPELLQPGVITPSTKSILANAAYFHGEWLTKFDVKNTINKEFVGTQKTAEVEMMNQRNRFSNGAINFNIMLIAFLRIRILELNTILFWVLLFAVVISRLYQGIASIIRRIAVQRTG